MSEISDMEFPVFAKGVHPVPGKKVVYSELGVSITCGGQESLRGMSLLLI
ncbi:hypothetical protein VCRA2110O318_40165 [Vibrio crassostreae]|nr:hypothetical protein VCRA2117O328_40167 [Vibrio crassostreae]CAK2337985.1 hypothetical protein VCRA2110O318_40165 [Vibrio crassostreae]CAK2507410.1 hypothetical protein VCRA2110O319_50166 [Vibrio crassostreae]CAK2898322.1 hypothetical protein VCRA217O317_30126 [Vibrio crassostreae]